MTNSSVMANGNWVKQTLHYLFILCPTLKVVQWPWQFRISHELTGNMCPVRFYECECWCIHTHKWKLSWKTNKTHLNRHLARENYPLCQKCWTSVQKHEEDSLMLLYCVYSYYLIEFFHALLCLLLIAFLNYPMEEWFNSVTSYPYDSSILSDFNQTSGRLQAAFTPNQVLQWKATGLCSLWWWQHDKALSCLVQYVGLIWSWTQPYLVRCIAKCPHPGKRGNITVLIRTKAFLLQFVLCWVFKGVLWGLTEWL